MNISDVHASLVNEFARDLTKEEILVMQYAWQMGRHSQQKEMHEEFMNMFNELKDVMIKV